MSQANRRSQPRQLRRVQVRIQRPGEERVQHGFTKNLSLSGAMISLADPPPRGCRLRLELVGKDHSPVIYGEVVHAHRVPPELRRFAESAMGVRFLDTGELVSPFLPKGHFRSDPGSEQRPEDGAAAATAAPSAGPQAESRPGGGTAAPSAPPGATYTLAFERPAEFLATYRRDLVNGGLFVPTSRPVALNQKVTVALHLPEPVRQTVHLQARVVQVVEPRSISGGRTSGGVGLEILDTDRVLATLRPLVGRLEA